MSKFKMDITLSKNLFKNEPKKEIIYFSRSSLNYADEIFFDKNIISLVGSRTNHIKTNDILETINSTFYNCMIKALLFVYFKKGPFHVELITINIDDSEQKSYEAKEIKQVFIKDKLLEINPDKLFSTKKISDIVMNSLMYLTLSFSDSDLIFDYTWKCFNALIKKIFDKEHDFDMLKELRIDIEHNPQFYPNILLFSKDIDCDYLNQCFFNAMICNNYPRGNCKRLPDFFKDFNDVRVLKILYEKIKSKKDDLTSMGEYESIVSLYESKIKENNNKDSDIIRIIILKYAYYLRCKYFHGEKSPANFLIKNMNYKELFRISKPLSIICKDLIENKLE